MSTQRYKPIDKLPSRAYPADITDKLNEVIDMVNSSLADTRQPSEPPMDIIEALANRQPLPEDTGGQKAELEINIFHDKIAISIIDGYVMTRDGGIATAAAIRAVLALLHTPYADKKKNYTYPEDEYGAMEEAIMEARRIVQQGRDKVE